MFTQFKIHATEVLFLAFFLIDVMCSAQWLQFLATTYENCFTHQRQISSQQLFQCIDFDRARQFAWPLQFRHQKACINHIYLCLQLLSAYNSYSLILWICWVQEKIPILWQSYYISTSITWVNGQIYRLFGCNFCIIMTSK